ncbi:MAG: anion permease [Solobacterium sp.]|nr:anion permease [Solobacterium sp.]MBR2843997.1 anion permease [Solobacterium sp.]
MTTQMYLCLGLFIFMIGGYVFAKKLHTTNGVVALCAIMLTVWSGIIPAKNVLGNFANQNVLLITGMFIVSAGFNRTQAVTKLSNMVYKIAGGNFTVVMAGYLLMTFLLCNLIPSPVAVFTIMAPLMSASCESFNISPSKVIFALGLVSVGTAGVLPIGGGAATFATQNGYLESYGYTDFQMQLLDPFKGRIVSALIILAYAIFIAPKFAPEQPSVPIQGMEGKGKTVAKKEPLDPTREFLGYFLFVMTTLGLVFSSKLGLDNWQVAMTGATLEVATGVLKPKEATGAVPFQIVLMLIAALSVGGAMVECGLGDLIGDGLAKALGGTHNSYIIGGAFFVIPFILTQFMQNQSVGNIFRPIAILTCKALGANPVGPLILLSAACLTAFLTPSATATVPLMMGFGGYDQKDLLKMGWLPSLIICIASVIVTMTVFPAF